MRPMLNLCLPILQHTLLAIAGCGAAFLPTALTAADAWTDITSPLLEHIQRSGAEPGWPGGCSGVIVNRLTGDLTVKVVGRGFWRSPDQGQTWQRLDHGTISGRDETGWASSADQNQPTRVVSFSLDGHAGWTTNGQTWHRFADLGRNWDFGSVNWAAARPQTIIAAKHETTPPGEVYASDDGGQSWRQLPIHLNESRGRVSMVGAMDDRIFIYSRGEGIFRSTDAGRTWTNVAPVNPLTRIPVLFADAHYLGTATGLVVSRDKGATWQSQGAPVHIWQGPFFGRNEKEMVVIGYDGVFRTDNAGDAWTKVAELKPKEKGFLFTPNWFGCYAWDPVNNALYAAAMGNPVYKLDLFSGQRPHDPPRADGFGFR